MYETQDETVQFTNLTWVKIYLGHILAHGFEAKLPLNQTDICGMKMLPAFNF